MKFNTTKIVTRYEIYDIPCLNAEIPWTVFVSYPQLYRLTCNWNLHAQLNCNWKFYAQLNWRLLNESALKPLVSGIALYRQYAIGHAINRQVKCGLKSWQSWRSRTYVR